MTPPAVPFFALDREFEELREPLLAAIERVLRSGQLLQGEEVGKLEAELAGRASRRHAVVVNSCTDALYLALAAAGIGPGDEVLAPDYTFPATASAILRTGATAVLVDVDETYGLDLDLAETAVGPATAAVVYAHLYGRIAVRDQVAAFAKRHGLALVEDAAQAFGAGLDGHPAGSLGLASCFSFDPTKVVGALGSGGAVLTDDDEVAATVRALRYHGRVGREFRRLGYNSQLPTLAAATLLVKLEAEERWLRRRRELAAAFGDALAGPGIEVPVPGEEREHVFHKFVVRTPERDALADELAARGVQTMVHYGYRIHELPFVAELPHRVVEGGQAEAATREVLSLPIHPHLREDEVERVLDAAAAFRARLDAGRAAAV